MAEHAGGNGTAARVEAFHTDALVRPRSDILVTAPAHDAAVTVLRTGIDPNVLAGANLARRIGLPSTFTSPPARPPAMTRSGLL